jgi:glutamate racemase
MSSSPIVVLDSGLGGLTVARAIRAALPQEEIIYFGDTARVPYGGKSEGTVAAFARQIISYLRPHDPKHVVVACNTATALALPELRKQFPELSISGVIEPGARAAAEAAGAKEFPVIAVIATEATIRSRAYELAIYKRRSHARMMFRPTPLLVPIIEEGRTDDDPLVRLALKQYLLPLHQRGMDVLVLGCTHYPILKDLIQRMVGPKVAVVDSAAACAEDVARRLRASGLLCGAPAMHSDRPRPLRCFVTDNSPRFAALASRFLGESIDQPTCVPLEDLHRSESEDTTMDIGLKVSA